MSEKQEHLPVPSVSCPAPRADRKRAWALLALGGLLVYSLCGHLLASQAGGAAPASGAHRQEVDWDAYCPQLPAYEHQLPPPAALTQPSQDHLAQLLSGALKVDTSVQDAMPHVGDAPEVWGKIFNPFLDYLQSAWPALHSASSPVTLEKINGHGLLYEWKGSDEDLKPLLLMAHQDVVPVLDDTRDAWVHDPFGGFYNTTSGLIWGRGSQDTKSSLVSILTAVQSLLEAEYKPKRTLLLAFGFDEERGGFEGAGHIAPVIEKRYGKNGVAMVVDEGGAVAVPEAGSGVGYSIAPATAEKGKLNIKATVQTQGGHSSVPPSHTGIGYISQLVVALEARPEAPVLDTTEHNPSWGRLLCDVARGEVQGPLREALTQVVKAEQAHMKRGCPKHARHLERAKAKALGLMSIVQRAAFQTTQATDLIHGGVKVNALPEQVEVIINYRIGTSSSSAALRKHVAKVVQPVAKANGLKLDAWSDAALSFSPPTASAGTIALSDAFESALEPAPVTPLTGPISKPWQLLSGVIRSVWDPATSPDAADRDAKLYISGGTSLGNTDTRYVHGSSPAVFRFSPRTLHAPTDEERALVGRWGAHTVNEHIHASALTAAWTFYTQLIRASDETADL